MSLTDSLTISDSDAYLKEARVRKLRDLFLWTTVSATILACGAARSRGFEGESGVCTPGETEDCQCDDGAQAKRSCEGGTWEACGPCGDLANRLPAPGCGDGICGGTETCETCAQDCGECPKCSTALACDKAMIPPAQSTAFPQLDVPMTLLTRHELRARLVGWVAQAAPAMRVLVASLGPAQDGDTIQVELLRAAWSRHPRARDILRGELEKSGLVDIGAYLTEHPLPLRASGANGMMTPMTQENQVDCGPPLLRVRIKSIEVLDKASSGTDVIYCIVSTEGQLGGEVRATPRTRPLNTGESHEFAIAEGITWGQNGPREPQGRLLLTYNCLESDSDEGYADILKSLGDSSINAGGAIGGQYGWVFGVAGVVGNVASTAIALNKDDALFNATQTLDDKEYDAMTRGAAWTVSRGKKCGAFCNSWEWKLNVEAWGCNKYGAL